MSLIYLITNLSELKRNKPLPISRQSFINQVKETLEQKQLLDFNLVLLLDDVEKIIYNKNKALMRKTDLSNKIFNDKLKEYQYKSHTDSDEFSWLYSNKSPQVLLRKWYQTIYIRAKSRFFKEWIRFSLNLEEVTSAILAKQNNLSKNNFLKQLEGRFDSSSQQMMNKYNESDLGISRRFAWYDQIKKSLSNDDFLAAEKEINSLKLKEIDKLLGIDIFSIDVVIAYYFRMKIIEREANFSYTKGKNILKLILRDYLEELHGY